mgnify:CR=1 FL=1
MCTYNFFQILYTGEDYKYFTKLKEVLNKVNVITVEFELLFRMKRNSNYEFHQDRKTRNNISLQELPPDCGTQDEFLQEYYRAERLAVNYSLHSR